MNQQNFFLKYGTKLMKNKIISITAAVALSCTNLGCVDNTNLEQSVLYITTETYKFSDGITEFKSKISHGRWIVTFRGESEGKVWCAACAELDPNLMSILEMYSKPGLRYGEVDLNYDFKNAEAITDNYGVVAVPTTLFFKDGTLTGRVVGVGSGGEFIRNIEAVLR